MGTCCSRARGMSISGSSPNRLARDETERLWLFCARIRSSSAPARATFRESTSDFNAPPASYRTVTMSSSFLTVFRESRLMLMYLSAARTL